MPRTPRKAGERGECDVCGAANRRVAPIALPMFGAYPIKVCVDCLALALQQATGYNVVKMIVSWDYNAALGEQHRASIAGKAD